MTAYIVLFGLNFSQNSPFFAPQKSNLGFAFENERTVRYQQRLDDLFKKIVAFAEDIELQSHWARYLCILVSGFLETSVRAIYSQYANTKAAPYVAHYVDSQLQSFQNPNMERILQLARSFSPEWEEHLRSVTQGEPKVGCLKMPFKGHF